MEVRIGDVEEFLFMRDDHKGNVVAVADFREQPDDAVCSLLVEVARRFVGKHDAGPVDDGARDRNALQLPA